MNSIVIPGLVPGIHLSACFGVSRSLDSGNECRNDGLTRGTCAPDVFDFALGFAQARFDGIAELFGALDGLGQFAVNNHRVD